MSLKIRLMKEKSEVSCRTSWNTNSVALLCSELYFRFMHVKAIQEKN